MSAQLIMNLRLPKYNNVITKEEIVKNLHSCSGSGTRYRLNVDAYIDHSANFRIGPVNDFFSRVGLPSMSHELKRDQVFREFLGSTKPELNLDHALDTSVFEPLEEIASRRNEIAHGMPSEILSGPILRELIDFVDAFAVGLHSILIEQVLKFDVEHRAITLKKAIKVIDNKILCVNLENQTIALGDVVIAVTKSNPAQYRRGKVLSLQVNGRPFKVVRRQPSVDVGIGLDCRSDQHTIFFS